MNDFRERYGPWAVVAGASEGLGAEFARQLAARGLNLLLVARRAALLESLATDLMKGLGVEVRTLALDLDRADIAAQLTATLAGAEVGLMVCNAAAVPLGPFLEQPLEHGLRALEVNVRAPLVMAHHFGRAMAQRGRGGLILLGSLTAFQGAPLVATYGATKAFNLVFAEGLAYELARHGVDVLAVCPGATSTPNFLKTNSPRTPGLLTPAEVVRDALSQLGKASMTIPGLLNNVSSFILRRLLPRRAAVALMGSQTERSFQDERNRMVRDERQRPK